LKLVELAHCDVVDECLQLSIEGVKLALLVCVGALRVHRLPIQACKFFDQRWIKLWKERGHKTADGLQHCQVTRVESIVQCIQDFVEDDVEDVDAMPVDDGGGSMNVSSPGQPRANVLGMLEHGFTAIEDNNSIIMGELLSLIVDFHEILVVALHALNRETVLVTFAATFPNPGCGAVETAIDHVFAPAPRS